jgi:hypothetical protein
MDRACPHARVGKLVRAVLYWKHYAAYWRTGGAGMLKLLSLRHWKNTFVFIYKLIMSKKVAVRDKLLFLIPVVVYWVIPDVMPFMPIDDIAFTMIIAEWFAVRMGRKYNIS